MPDGLLTLAKTRTPPQFVWSFSGTDVAELDPTMVVISRDPDGRWYVTFAVDLNILGMVRNHHLARAISDAGWGESAANSSTSARGRAARWL